MTDDQLLRYSRHILLHEIGIEGQQKLLDAHALVIGVGGLGSPAALYLGATGVGHITLVDDDEVDLTNLQRQITHSSQSLGLPKVNSTKNAVLAINPGVQVTSIRARADSILLNQLVAQVDVVLDCCDNFATRHAINVACIQHRKPLVSGAAIRFDGQISVYDPRNQSSPCYACVFPWGEDFEETRCSTMGIFAPLVGIIGSMQAAEALKLIINAGTSLAGRLLMLEGLNMQWNEVRLPRDPACKVCRHI